MNRLLFVFGILFYAEAFHNCRHHGHSWHLGHRRPWHRDHGKLETKTETKLEEIERKLIEQDIAFQNFCNEKKINGTKELYGLDSYFLKYYLPEAKNSDVKVEIKHRFIYITIEKNNNGQTDKVFEDIRILPEMVKFEDANWFESSGDIVTITIPYKVPIGTETIKDCGVFNKNFINVPKVIHPGPGIIRRENQV